jgi:lipopolysaccharide transport system permease protein
MNYFYISIKDITNGFLRLGLIQILGWQDVKQRYRRSTLGPFWLTLSMALTIGTMGLIFGKILNIPYKEFLPYLAAGMIIWAFISSTITEGCQSLIIAEPVIKQLPIPFSVYIFRVIWRNIVILFHNLIILPIVLILTSSSFTYIALLGIPGLLLVLVNLIWITLILGILCARLRDLPQIIVSILGIIFYLTPIIWMPNNLITLPYIELLNFNPFYHFIEVIREPILGRYPSASSWIFCLVSAFFGSILGMLALGYYRYRIVYWL